MHFVVDGLASIKINSFSLNYSTLLPSTKKINNQFRDDVFFRFVNMLAKWLKLDLKQTRRNSVQQRMIWKPLASLQESLKMLLKLPWVTEEYTSIG